MTTQAKDIIEEFGTLPDQEKREVLAELIRMARDIDYPAVSDDELLSAADQVFFDYDRQETAE